jgi:hypothetical protein
VESVVQGLQNKNSIPGRQILNPLNSNHIFQRMDGRQVISLQFNPYFIEGNDEKQKIYDNYMRDIIEFREKTKGQQGEVKTKQEDSNHRKLWLNIVKKDIPKAFRLY